MLSLFVVLTLMVCIGWLLLVDAKLHQPPVVNSSKLVTTDLFDAVKFHHKKLRKARNVDDHQDGHYVIIMKNESNSIASHIIGDLTDATDDPNNPVDSRNVKVQDNTGSMVTAELKD